jgi:hypothetical protein
VVFALAIALALAGCYASAGPSPVGGAEDVIANLVVRGVTVNRTVSGDAGCADQTLYDNAVHLTTSYQGQVADLYIFEWRRASDFDAAASSFEGCVEAFRVAHPDATVAQLESSPWRAFVAARADAASIVYVLSEALHDAGGA